MNDETCITWLKSTGRFGVDMEFMSKIEATELFKQLQDKSISKDEAVALICNSDLDEIQKVVVAVNIGEWKNAHTPWYSKVKRYFTESLSIHN
ncbi:MAG: hypothetical protein KAQ85_00150 [Thermodesulfovibrionia bacterium]|nr:hypothetical protein [Thermodesulfovibrionia bacterium]